MLLSDQFVRRNIMPRITMSNIENFTYLFDTKNDQFQNISWAEPIFIAMARAYQNDEEITLYIDNEYVKNMIQSTYKENRTYSPIEQIKSRTGLEKISSHLTSIMLQNFISLSQTDQKDLRDYLQYLFLELMNNVADHSHSLVGGYAMAQYYPAGKKIQFVVADRGVAFLKNMQLNFTDIQNEEEAIKKALQKGITSTEQKMYGQPKNAGFGLYAMFEILKMTGGKFVIISNDTLLRYESEEFEIKKLLTPWKGVVASFEFFEANINYKMDEFTSNYLWNIDDEDEDYF